MGSLLELNNKIDFAIMYEIWDYEGEPYASTRIFEQNAADAGGGVSRLSGQL
jgi:hypothetical protein